MKWNASAYNSLRAWRLHELSQQLTKPGLDFNQVLSMLRDILYDWSDNPFGKPAIMTAEETAYWRTQSEKQPVPVIILDDADRLMQWPSEDASALKTQSEKQPVPVIILDDADRLMQWPSEDASALKTLMGLFEKMTKQDGVAQLILATSKSFLWEWLYKYTLAAEVVEIGHLPEVEARECFHNFLLPSHLEVPEAAWPMVYSVCGGNIYDLRRLIHRMEVYMNRSDQGLEEALQFMVLQERHRLDLGLEQEYFRLSQDLLPPGCPSSTTVLWSAKQCQCVYHALVEHGGRVPWRHMVEMLRNLPKDDTVDLRENAVLKALVHVHLVSRRMYTSLTRDYDTDDFLNSDGMRDQLVVPYSPVSLAALRQMQVG
eukprot:jgi/Chlat1/7524/Chrsp61S07009